MIEIQSRQNAALKHLARLGRERKYRRSTGKMLCEGEKMLGEALRSGAKLKTVLVRDGWDSPLVKEAEEQGASLYSAPDALFKLASEVETPQNVIFSCEQPQWTADALDRSRAGAPAGRLTGPGQPWHDLTHRRSVRARRPLCCARAAPIRFHPRSCARRWARCSVCRA